MAVAVTREQGAPSYTRYLTFDGGEPIQLDFKGTDTATATVKVNEAKGYEWTLGTADDPDVDGGGTYVLSVNAVDTQESWEKADLTVTDIAGTELKADESGAYELAWTGEANYILVESVAPEGADVVLDADDYTVTYEDAEGTTISDPRDIKDEGTYYAVVTVTNEASEYKTVTPKKVEFSIVKSLGELTAFIDADNDGKMCEGEDAITYDGTELNNEISFAGTDGKAVTATAKTFYNADGAANATVENAGKYTASVTVNEETAVVEFEVAKLDLEAATVSANDVEVASYDREAVLNGTTLTVNGKEIKGSNITSIPGVEFAAPAVISAAGEYAATIYAADNQDQENVIGSKEIAFKAVGALVDVENGMIYGNDNVIAGETLTFDASSADKNYQAFDAEAVHVKGVDDDYVVVTVVDKDGNVVSAPTAGNEYTVNVAVATQDNSKGGKSYFKIKVINGTLEGAVATVTYKGEVVSGVEATYDGSDVMDDVKVTVKSGKDTLVEGDDYELVLAKGGKEVDSAVDAGSYVLTIKGTGFEGSIAVPVTVAKAEITSVKVQGYMDNMVAWTGEEITPVFLFTTTELKDGKVPADAEWAVLPADQYFATYEPEEVKDAGEYVATLKPTYKMVNYYFTAGDETSVTFEVTEHTVFEDVSSGAWYAPAVYKAFTLGYMKGQGASLFVPGAEMTRAEFAQVLFNMATEKNSTSDNPTGTFPTQFEDVDGTAWYAEAVSWAVNSGMFYGTSDTTFEPNGKITREQIAAVFYRYAANGEAADASALDAFVDGDAVSSWAETAMAWAVEAGVVSGKDGNALDPQGLASRAEVAALAVRVQPENLENPEA